MVGTGILSNNMMSPSPECYTTFWMMTINSDTLHWLGITPIFYPISDLDLITEFDFYLIARGFHRTFATGAACQQRMLTPPDTWSCPTFGLASVDILRQMSPELVLFPDFWVSNIPQYFCFCINTCLTIPLDILVIHSQSITLNLKNIFLIYIQQNFSCIKRILQTMKLLSLI